MGKKVSETELTFVVEGKKREDILRHFLGELSQEDIILYGNRKDGLFRQAAVQLQPMPGVLEFMKQLEEAGMGKAIVTSASAERTHRTLARLGMERCFSPVVTGDDVVAGKPDPAVYLLALQRLQELPDTLLALEDGICGVQAAKSAGLRCVAVGNEQRAAELLRAGADGWIPGFTGLSLAHLKRCLSNTL